jgi:hypothetical protein
MIKGNPSFLGEIKFCKKSKDSNYLFAQYWQEIKDFYNHNPLSKIFVIYFTDDMSIKCMPSLNNVSG